MLCEAPCPSNPRKANESLPFWPALAPKAVYFIRDQRPGIRYQMSDVSDQKVSRKERKSRHSLGICPCEGGAQESGKRFSDS